jgi:hypothetical protein
MSKPPALLSPVASPNDDPLYRAAVEVDQDEALAAEMAEWEEVTLADGLGKNERHGKPVP